MSCSVDLGGRRIIKKLWLWCGQAATALIWSLAWEPPYATVRPLRKRQKKKKKREREREKNLENETGNSAML